MPMGAGGPGGWTGGFGPMDGGFGPMGNPMSGRFRCGTYGWRTAFLPFTRILDARDSKQAK